MTNMKCKNGHRWQESALFEKVQEQILIKCPYCKSKDVSITVELYE